MQDLLFATLAIYVLGMISAIVLRRAAGRAAVAVFAALGSSLGAAAGVSVLASGREVHLAPALSALHPQVQLQADPLGAVFLVLIGLVAVPAALYGFGYSKSYEGRYSLAALGVVLNALLLFLTLTVTATSPILFLFAWEGMTLAGFAAVLTEHDRQPTIRAATWYVAISHVGFLALVVMFLVLSGGDLSASFADIRTNAESLSPVALGAAFLLALAGFGAKAGIVPLHVWLPMAHPVAPSHISALLSGVVVKVAIYGFMRISLDLAGAGPAWWGGVALGIGAVSAIGGVLYALMQQDLKRLLAFSTVENVGIMLIAAGAAIVFRSYGLDELAILSIVACLYHALAHGVFKALLFLGAGSVLHATGSRDMEMFGGLSKRMPWTSAFFLLGAVAAAALPPLSGFASEWMVFQALLGGARIADPEGGAVMSVAAGALALAGGLAAACFVRAFGITFLGLARSEESEVAHESPRSMRAGMGLLALGCIALGLLPSVIVPLLARAATGVEGRGAAVPSMQLGLALATPSGLSSFSPFALATMLLVAAAAIGLSIRMLQGPFRTRLSVTWGCGRFGQTSRMQYTATAFAEPLRRVFASVYRPLEDVSVDYHPDSKYFVYRITYASDLRQSFAAYFYHPLLLAVRIVAMRVRRLQSGSVHAYLLYVSLTVLLVLLVARVWH